MIGSIVSKIKLIVCAAFGYHRRIIVSTINDIFPSLYFSGMFTFSQKELSMGSEIFHAN